MTVPSLLDERGSRSLIQGCGAKVLALRARHAAPWQAVSVRLRRMIVALPFAFVVVAVAII